MRLFIILHIITLVKTNYQNSFFILFTANTFVIRSSLSLFYQVYKHFICYHFFNSLLFLFVFTCFLDFLYFIFANSLHHCFLLSITLLTNFLYFSFSIYIFSIIHILTYMFYIKYYIYYFFSPSSSLFSLSCYFYFSATFHLGGITPSSAARDVERAKASRQPESAATFVMPPLMF